MQGGTSNGVPGRAAPVRQGRGAGSVRGVRYRADGNTVAGLTVAHAVRGVLGLLIAALASAVRGVLGLLIAALATAAPALAQGGDAEPCPNGGYDPAPVAVPVTAVPIVVESTTDAYFVLYVRHDVGGEAVEVPVLVVPGEAGTTTLAENVEALPPERYRVEKYPVADPADVDGDCIDDLTELADPAGMNPLNPAAGIDIHEGAVILPDHATYEELVHVAVKFILLDLNTSSPRIYFTNTRTHELVDALLGGLLGMRRPLRGAAQSSMRPRRWGCWCMAARPS